MLVQVNTDNHIKKSDELISQVQTEVDDTLSRFADQITRVEVHLRDVNGSKGGIDKTCLMEARLAGLQPVTVTHAAESVDEALSGAAEKLERLLDHTLSKLNDVKGNISMGGDQVI